jgi:hypothetical protein
VACLEGSAGRHVREKQKEERNSEEWGTKKGEYGGNTNKNLYCTQIGNSPTGQKWLGSANAVQVRWLDGKRGGWLDAVAGFLGWGMGGTGWRAS